MGIKSSLTCDVCGKDVPLEDNFAQITLNAHEMKWEEGHYDSPFRADVEHVAQMNAQKTRVVCMECGTTMVKAIERMLSGKKKIKPEVVRPKRYQLIELDSGDVIDLGTYRVMYGEIDDTDRERMVAVMKDLTTVGHLVGLLEVE